MLFVRALRRQFFFLILVIGTVFAASHVWADFPLIAVPPEIGFCNQFEPLLPPLLLLPIAFLLYDRYEITLGLVCGAKTSRMMLSRWSAYTLYAALGALIVLACNPYDKFGLLATDGFIIPLYVPKHYKLYLLGSVLVTVLFFSSLFLFLRVALKNCYAPMGLGFAMYLYFFYQNASIRNGETDIRMCLFDPFLSDYVLGDTVLVGHYGLMPLWTYNRLLFFVLAVGMLAASYALLRGEKLHQGFSD